MPTRLLQETQDTVFDGLQQDVLITSAPLALPVTQLPASEGERGHQETVASGVDPEMVRVRLDSSQVALIAKEVLLLSRNHCHQPCSS